MKLLGILRNVLKGRSQYEITKRCMFQGIAVPIVLYGCEAWAIVVNVQKRMNVLETKCSRTICGVRRGDQIGNDRVNER